MIDGSCVLICVVWVNFGLVVVSVSSCLCYHPN